MLVLVCGGRGYDDRRRLFITLDLLHENMGISTLVSGGAKGADSLAVDWAKSRLIPFKVVRAEWGRYGKRAGPLRNQQMLEMKPDLVVAFPGGRGTADMMGRALDAGLRVIDIRD